MVRANACAHSHCRGTVILNCTAIDHKEPSIKCNALQDMCFQRGSDLYIACKEMCDINTVSCYQSSIDLDCKDECESCDSNTARCTEMMDYCCKSINNTKGSSPNHCIELNNCTMIPITKSIATTSLTQALSNTHNMTSTPTSAYNEEVYHLSTAQW